MDWRLLHKDFLMQRIGEVDFENTMVADYEKCTLMETGLLAETGRCTKRKVWQLLRFLAFLLPLLERLQLTVLALIACAACTKARVLCPLARLPASFLVNAKSLRTNERMKTNEVRRNERVRSSLFATFWEGGCLCRRSTRERKVCVAVLERTTLRPTL